RTRWPGRHRLPARGVLGWQPEGAAPALPGRDHRERRGRRRARPERGQRRAPGGAAGAGRRAHRRVEPAGVPAGAGRAVRAAQGRWWPEVLHPGGEVGVMTTLGHTAEAVAQAQRWTTHNYHPLPVVLADASGAWVTDIDGRRYLDCLAGYSALNF